MSRTAKGSIVSVPENRFSASFHIDGGLINASGRFSSNLPNPEFGSSDALLKFDSLEQLTSNRNFMGQIGVTDFQLTLDNGPVITGSLTVPVNPPIRVTGTVNWSGYKEICGTLAVTCESPLRK
jgi:hypothetical protein